MMKLRVAAVCTSLVALALLSEPAGALTADWTTEFGSRKADTAEGVAADASGVYVVGWTDGTLPGQTSQGGRDAFIRKLDTSGAVVWAHQFGTSEYDVATGVASDATGIYIAGTTEGALPGQTNEGGSDVFIQKLDPSGNVMWTDQFGTKKGDFSTHNGVAVDATGVYVPGFTTGRFEGEADQGGEDAFIRKFDTDGSPIWTREFGTRQDDEIGGVATEAAGVYVAGYTTGRLPGQRNHGGLDAFVRKYDSSGAAQWTHEFGSRLDDYAFGVATDAGGVYVAGSTSGALPGQANEGGEDAFVKAWAADGTSRWTTQFGTRQADYADAVAADATGVYAVGDTTGALPGQASTGGDDVFLRTFDAAGAVMSTIQFGTKRDEFPIAAAVAAGTAYAVGLTDGTFPGEAREGAPNAFAAQVA